MEQNVPALTVCLMKHLHHLRDFMNPLRTTQVPLSHTRLHSSGPISCSPSVCTPVNHRLISSLTYQVSQEGLQLECQTDPQQCFFCFWFELTHNWVDMLS